MPRHIDPHLPVPPPRLPRSLDAWKSPTAGHKDRNPDLLFVMEAEFRSAPSLAAFQPWTLLRLLEELLGDHRLELISHTESKLLFRSPLPWRTAPYCTSLHVLLSSLAREEGWEHLGAPWADRMCTKAMRGGGKTRHEVWRLDIQPAFARSPGSIRLDLRTRHIAKDQVPRLDELARHFFTSAARADAFYGRGDLLTEDPRSLEPRLDVEDQEDLWRNASEMRGPVVPWVHRYNLLGENHIARLGGIDSLKKVKEADASAFVVPMSPGALVITAAPGSYDLSPLLVVSDREFGRRDAATWLLSRFSAANMLAVQNMMWVAAQFRAAQEYNERKVPAVEPRRPSVNWIERLKDRPPRFLHDCAAAATTALKPALAKEIHAHTTHFDIRSRDGKPALTLYGRACDDPTQLTSPVHAGSLKPERATFVFDSILDGWDGMVSDGPVRPRMPRLKQFTCPGCDLRFFHLRAVLEYPEDLDELNKDEQAHAEDYFTWFWLIATCAGCQWQGVVADVECA